jgi:hypothetical protein
LPTKENKFLLHIFVSSKQTKVFRFLFLFATNKQKVPFAAVSKGKWNPKAIFFNLFTVCSSCKRKFVICPFVDEEKNGSYPFATKLNGLAHLWLAYAKKYLKAPTLSTKIFLICSNAEKNLTKVCTFRQCSFYSAPQA